MSTLARITLGRLVPPGSGTSPGPPEGVVGGFINTEITLNLVAAVSKDTLDAGLPTNTLSATLTPNLTAEISNGLSVDLGPDLLEVELNDG